jgi:1-acyl-sn-glycerol-3-phosphate acyltransferase
MYINNLRKIYKELLFNNSEMSTKSYVRKPQYRLKRIIESSSQPISKFIVRYLAKKYVDIRIVGMDRKPRDKSFIEVYNHVTCGDGPIAASYEKHWICHWWIQMSDPENRKSLVRKVWDDFRIWLWGQIKVKVIFEEGIIRAGNKDAIKRSLQYLGAFGKDVICVFPEGPTMKMREYIRRGEKPPFHRGAAHLSLVTGSPIVPVGIYVNIPEGLKPVILEATPENVRMMKRYIKENGKLEYRISYGYPMYVDEKSTDRCRICLGNKRNPVAWRYVYFNNKKHLENILISHAMDMSYQLAKADNLEGKLVY